MNKRIFLSILAMLSLPASAENKLNISCVENGSDPYQLSVQIRGNNYSYVETHRGRTVQGTYPVVSVDTSFDYLKIVVKDPGMFHEQTIIYELTDGVLTMQTVTTDNSNGEVIDMNKGAMSNQCVTY